MSYFRSIQGYIELAFQNIGLVFDSSNICAKLVQYSLYQPQGHPIFYKYPIIFNYNTVFVIKIALFHFRKNEPYFIFGLTNLRNRVRNEEPSE